LFTNIQVKKCNELIQCLERGHKGLQRVTCTLKYTNVKNSTKIPVKTEKQNNKLRQIKVVYTSFKHCQRCGRHIFEEFGVVQEEDDDDDDDEEDEEEEEEIFIHNDNEMTMPC